MGDVPLQCRELIRLTDWATALATSRQTSVETYMPGSSGGAGRLAAWSRHPEEQARRRVVTVLPVGALVVAAARLVGDAMVALGAAPCESDEARELSRRIDQGLSKGRHLEIAERV